MSFGSSPFGSTPFGSSSSGTTVSVSDALAMLEYPVGERYLAIVDGLAASEATQHALMPGIIERLLASEALAGTADMMTELTSGLYLDDLPLAAWILLVTEGLTLTEDLATNQRQIVLAADILIATGLAQTRMDAIASLASAIALDDLARAGYDAAMADTAEFAEALAVAMDMAAALVEQAVLSDAVSNTVRIVVLAGDELESSDSLTLVAALQAAISDSVSVFASIRTGGAEYSAWVLNTENRAPSQYRNYPFNSLAELDQSHFGATEFGLFVLDEGDDDDGDPIDAFVRSGLSNMGTGKMKRMPSMYLGYKADGSLVLKALTIENGAKVQTWYGLSTNPTAAPGPGRIKLGKGLKSVYWGYELHNVAGSDFELDVVALYPMILDRRL